MATARLKGGTGVLMKVDNLERLSRDIEALAKSEVLAGFPEDTTDRTDDEDPGSNITNAAIAYVQDHGEPDRNVPARPFMLPAMEAVQDRAESILKQAAKAMLKADSKDRDSLLSIYLTRVGLAIQAAIRKKINEGIPPPLSEATLRRRAARGRVGAMWELAWRDAGAPASTELAKPLIDTGQLRNAVNFVIRERKERKG